jgi:hypothetical protein
MTVFEQAKGSVEAASHLTSMDVGAVEAYFALARKIDAWDEVVRWAIEDAGDTGSRPTVPQNDNVSLSAFLKYSDQLGLTPAGRKALDQKVVRAGGKLSAIRGDKSA